VFAWHVSVACCTVKTFTVIADEKVFRTRRAEELLPACKAVRRPVPVQMWQRWAQCRCRAEELLPACTAVRTSVARASQMIAQAMHR
jgi:hypothetical protein